MHSVAFHEALVLLVDGSGRGGERPDVVIQVPAQVLIKHCGQQMEFFVIFYLHDSQNKAKEKVDGLFLHLQHYAKRPYKLLFSTESNSQHKVKAQNLGHSNKKCL